MGAAPGLGYIGALDGLRAIGLLFVLLYHHQVPVARGGYYGVSSFFTLSGFLITSLAIGERQRTGRLSWAAFWERRARRLLPAAMVALATVVALTSWASIASGPRLRGDVLSAIGYVTNWRLAAGGGEYADLFSSPSPVVHFWSLAIEEQFYLLFPLGFVGLMAAVRGRLGAAAGVAGAAAAASFAVAWWSAAAAGNDGITYYGTHTRASELLVGVALAFVLAAWRGRPAPRHGDHAAGAPASPGRPATRTWVLTAAGFVAVAGLVRLWTLMPIGDERVFRGGTVVNSLLTCVVIVAAVGSRRFDAVLGARPLRTVGRVSYGAYLFHWPLFLLLSTQRTGLDGSALFAVRVAATMAAAAASYWLVEKPFRTGLRMPRPRLAAVVASGVTAVVVLTAVAPQHPAQFADLDLGATRVTDVGSGGATGGSETVAPPPGAVDAGTVLIAGDSVAFTLIPGFQQWSQEHPDRALTLGAVTPFGCPIGGPGRYVIFEELPTWPECGTFRDDVSAFIAHHRVDATVVVMGLADLNGREVAGRWRPLGDPVYDRWLLAQLDDVARRLDASGAPTFWLTFPYVRVVDPDDPTRPWHDIPVNEPWKVDRFNQLIRQTAAAHPAIRVVDLASWLETWPHESFDPADRDGVHFSVEASGRVAEWLVPRILEHLATTPRPGGPTVPRRAPVPSWGP
ncbi:MAG TPA: acyltransferase family protein [Acidimicrobiales bacterium]|nr:acyltransferase family protein [Acidimicrobiales bacterium]